MDADLAEWIRTRPPQVQELIRQWPPHCVVRAVEGRTLQIPGPGRTARVVSYFETGLIAVMHDSEIQGAIAECQPEWLELVRYDDVTPEDVDQVLAEEPV